MNAPLTTQRGIVYPESDGLPMADNTVQYRLMVTIQGGLDALFRDNPQVFVAGNLFWYPIEGDNQTRQAPDILIVFGRPKGDRGSYRQWEEDNIPPQVVFEILSPSNRGGEMIRKFRFYERFGVEEYYVYDPDNNELNIWVRTGNQLEEIPYTPAWTSPRLGVRFDLSSGELRVIGPDGLPFPSFVELAEQRDLAIREAQNAQQRAERLAAQLRALGIEPQS